MSGDAMEMMKAAHKRDSSLMRETKGCTVEAHKAIVIAIEQGQSDSEITYFALQEVPEKVSDMVIKKLNGQAESLRKPPAQTSRKDETKIEYGKLRVSTHSVEVANAIIKVAGILIFIGMFIFGAKFLAELRHEIVAKVSTIEAKVK